MNQDAPPLPLWSVIGLCLCLVIGVCVITMLTSCGSEPVWMLETIDPHKHVAEFKCVNGTAPIVGQYSDNTVRLTCKD